MRSASCPRYSAVNRVTAQPSMMYSKTMSACARPYCGLATGMLLTTTCRGRRCRTWVSVTTRPVNGLMLGFGVGVAVGGTGVGVAVTSGVGVAVGATGEAVKVGRGVIGGKHGGRCRPAATGNRQAGHQCRDPQHRRCQPLGHVRTPHGEAE